MDLGIKGRTAIVAAASKGLGRAVAFELAREGANLAICARGEEALRETARELGRLSRVLPVVADLTRTGDVQQLVRRTVDAYGRLDILVTNAGGPPAGLFTDFDDRAWEDAVTLNLLSTVRLCREAVPHMRRGGWGRIVNLVSIAARQPLERLVLSNSIRAAVLGLAKTLAAELARDGILVNSVCPGWILTDRLTSIVRGRGEARGTSYEDALRDVTAGIPLGRCGTPEEVAGLVVFLASERASYITGATIQVDGGLLRSTF